MPLTVVAVVALLEASHGLVGDAAGLVVDEARFGVVDAAAVVVGRCGDEYAQGLVITAAAEAHAGGGGKVSDPGVPQQLHAGADPQVGEGLAIGGRGPRSDVDRA